MHVAAWYYGTLDQSSPNSGNVCPLARPLTMSNFISFRQTVYDKSITPFTFLAPQGTP